MAIAEMLFPYDQSRGDLLFARRRKSRGGQPRRRPRPEIPFTPPQPPDKGRFKFTRGQIIIGGAIIAGGTIATLLKPWEWLPQEADKSSATKERYTTPELEKLGQQLREWKLRDGRKMSDLFTEVELTADLLQGNLDPKTILPHFKAPLTLSSDTKIGELLLDYNRDPNDPRKVEIYTRRETYTANWLSTIDVKLKLSPDIQASEARFYIVVKELSQLIHRIEYQRLYISLLKSGGNVRLEMKNPTNIPTPEAEQTANFGMTLGGFERSRFGYSSLDDFIDVGSRLHTAPIGATQRLDLEKRRQPVSHLYWSRVERADTDFLKSKGLLREKDGIVTWAKPFVIDEDFFLLFADYTRAMRRVLILP